MPCTNKLSIPITMNTQSPKEPLKKKELNRLYLPTPQIPVLQRQPAVGDRRSDGAAPGVELAKPCML